MMNPERYFAKWDVAGAGNNRLRTPIENRAITLNSRTARSGYTRQLLRSGCVLICLEARGTPVVFDYRSRQRPTINHPTKPKARNRTCPAASQPK